MRRSLNNLLTTLLLNIKVMATHTTTRADPSSPVFELHSLPTSNPGDLQDETPSNTAVEVLQKWNSPRINMLRVFATFWSFFVVGMNDGSYGVTPALPSKLQKLTGVGVGSTRMNPLSIKDPLTFAAGEILRPKLHSRLSHLPFPIRWLHPRLNRQQLDARQVRATRSSHRRPSMPPNLLHNLLYPPSLPRARRNVYLRRFRQRPH